MKQILLAAAAAALLISPAAAQLRGMSQVAVEAPQLQTLEGEARAQALAEANAVLNATRRLQGRFTQRAPDGSISTGDFYMQRPGRLRFAYDPPASLLIVSDGRVVAMRDTALRTTDRTPLRSTPLNLILGERVDLARDARIVRVSRSGPWLLVTMRDRSGVAEGAITLHFHGPDAQLRSWDVVDVAGARTRITLSNLSQPASLDRALFRLEDMLEQRSGPRG